MKRFFLKHYTDNVCEMWQSPLNKHLYENSTCYAAQQNEFAANLLQMQKLHLADILPNLVATTASVPQSLYSNDAASSLIQSKPAITSGPDSPRLSNNLQQYLRHRVGKSATVSSSEQWSPEVEVENNNSNRNLLLSNSSILSTNVATSPSHAKATILNTPPAVAALSATAQLPVAATVLSNMLPFDILTETFSRLNALHLTNPNLAQTITQLVANSSPMLPTNFYYPSNSRTIISDRQTTTLPLTASLTANKNLHTSQHLNLFKQYLSIEQHQLQQHLIALKGVNATRTNNLNAFSSSSNDDYNNTSMNSNQLPASSSNILKSSCCCFPNCFDCDQQQQLQRSLRKRRDDLRDMFTKKSISSQTLDLTDTRTDDWLPPPKKKWIRHYLKANNHQQLHAQNGNGSGNNSNNNNSMMVDEIPPTQQNYSSVSQHSPPRHVSSSLGASAGSHYMHMINAAVSPQSGLSGSGANHVTHTAPRRRTISSTSNGAGTREVHNKLEKNRRAHLKECYEALKNQLSLKDEDRRKTSNLAILGEALKCVQSYQKRNHELEAEWEHLANEKINLQKRIVSLKRELGPKYEQIFSGIFPDIEVGNVSSERETINDAHSLSSGRGSTLYSSSSSLSSGGSNGSNTMSSPLGAGLQTALPTTITPVINKIDNSNINSTSPISINSNSNVVIQQQHQRKNSSVTTTTTTTIQSVAIPTQGRAGGGGVNSPPVSSPTAILTFGSSLPLSLTAKNISATAVTRGSPTPSTPSPSPSSSSGVSSSSSLISSSPPINGVINNGRNGTVNIPNGLKLQAAAVSGSGSIIGGSGTTATTAQGVNNTNNAKMLQALRGCHLV